MTHLQRLNARYAAAASTAAQGVELLTVSDTVGAHLNASIKELIELVRADGPELWGDLLGVSRQLRWRLVTEPQPIRRNLQLQEIATSVISQANLLHPVVGEEARAILEQLGAAAEDVREYDPIIGPVLLRCINEVGAESCTVFAAGSRSASGIAQWLQELGLSLRVTSGVDRGPVDVADQGYAVGPPRLFPPAVVTSPIVEELTFLFPSWETNRSIPRSALAAQAEGAIRPRSRTFIEGTEPVLTRTAPDVVDDLVPFPVWTSGQAPDREPRRDEVLARRVLLSGGLAIYLDGDGEHIRSLDPTQPPGERVTQSNVSLVGPGTYLVLREGQTERQALYDRAVLLMGERGPVAETSQEKWKDALQARLSELGRQAVNRALARAGVRTSDRATAWTEQTVARPQSDQDFQHLLAWLDMPLQPAFQLATELRRLRLQASADVRESLERALSAASMSSLEREGHLRLDLDLPGFRGIIATRVLAVAPHQELVGRHEARVPQRDRSAQWLE